jgi:hypothetical protein
MMTDLARQLADHPRWEWKPGIVDADGDIYLCPRGKVTSYWVVCGDDARNGVAEVDWARSDACTPDINHPATKGWLLAMLREATGRQDMRARPIDNGWYVQSLRFDRPPAGATEGEALARALLTAWGES